MFFAKKDLLTRVLTLSSFFLFPIPAIANTNTNKSRNYNPPSSEKIDQRRTVGSGSRSHCQSPLVKDSLTLLVPSEEVVHYTTSSNPSFYVYAKTSVTVPLRFDLVIPEPINDNPLVEKILPISRPGVYQIKLPTQVKLETERVYVWQIGIPCSNNPQQINQVLQAAVKRVPVSDQLAHRLQLADSPLEEAQIYASSGIWYDALSSADDQDPEPAKSVNYVQILVQEVGIKLETRYLSSFNSSP